MVEPRHQPITPLGRYSGVKELPVRSWDRNKARIESIYQLPTRDFRQTAAQFGVPPSIADITSTEKGIPKMECTTTTKSDFCPPSLDRYMTVPGICPDRDYPSSTGLEYCPGRPSKEEKPSAQLVSTPVMPRTRSTCPASMSSLLPNSSAVPKLNYPPSYPSCSAKNGDDFVEPIAYARNRSFASNDAATKPPDYTPKVDYFSQQPGFKWPVPMKDSSLSPRSTKKELDVNFDIDSYRQEELLPKPDFQGGGESNRNHSDYLVETKDHAEKRRLHDLNIERARLDYEKMIGSPGSTAPMMKAGVDPPSAVAHYNVPDYTQGATAGGIVRPRFGAPNVEMKVPITDPSYPLPEYRVPPPEAGLTKMTYTGMKDEKEGKPGVAYTPPVRYPDQIYSTPGHAQDGGNTEVPRPPLITSGGNPPCRYIPSIIEAQGGQSKSAPANNPQTSQPLTANDDMPQSNANTNVAKVELPSMKGLRRIQTTNQVYGSWIDDPYLKGNDWWFKAKAKMPIQKTYLSRYKEESGWH